ncbi:MAG: glutamate cyclase domain-containing protein [Armatimonadota bacterium]
MLPYENIDQLITMEMRPHNMVQGVVPQLYRMVRASGTPLTYRAATALGNYPGARLALITGIPLPGHLPKGEIDGPVGVVALARSLLRLGYRPEILVPDELVSVINVMQPILDVTAPVVTTTGLSTETVQQWILGYDGAIAVEKLGRNRKGVRHSIMGTPVPASDLAVDDLVDGLTREGKLTIGIGDGGNEMGFGKIFHLAREIVPRGVECGCPCGDGIITSTTTHHLLPAAVSNFGAYGLVAALSVMHQRHDLLPDGPTIVRTIEAAVEEGCLDGARVDPTFIGDDGIPGASVAAVVTLLGTVISQWFTSFDRHF